MVPQLVECVHSHLCKSALGGRGVVVDHRSLPVFGLEPSQHVGEELGRVGELARHILENLLHIAVVINSLVAAHRFERRNAPSAGEDYPLTLHDEHVSHVAGVLQRRPRRRLGPRPDLRIWAVTSRPIAAALLTIAAPAACARAGSWTNPHSAHRSTRFTLLIGDLKVPRGVGLGSAAGHEGDDDVGGMSVEVLASRVVDGGGSGVGVTGDDLDVS
jgi:hypothetical protein